MFGRSWTASSAPGGSASSRANSASRSCGAGPWVATKFEAVAQRPVRGQAGDQDLSELATRDDSVAGVAGVAAIPLQKHEPMLVWLAKAQSLQPKPIAETSTFPSLRLRIVLRPLIP